MFRAFEALLAPFPLNCGQSFQRHVSARIDRLTGGWRKGKSMRRSADIAIVSALPEIQDVTILPVLPNSPRDFSGYAVCNAAISAADDDWHGPRCRSCQHLYRAQMNMHCEPVRSCPTVQVVLFRSQSETRTCRNGAFLPRSCHNGAQYARDRSVTGQIPPFSTMCPISEMGRRAFPRTPESSKCRDR
jgi:hypothetical protein